VNFYSEAELSSQIGVCLSLQIPIECKHREGLEVFGFPYQDEARKLASYPISSDLIGSTLISNLAKNEPRFFKVNPLSAIGLVEFERGPKRVSGEDLFYKAGSALYDFIKADLEESAKELAEVDDSHRGTAILHKFCEYFKDTQSVPWWFDVQTWLDELPKETYLEYNEQLFSGLSGPLYYGITVSIPIICVDSPLHSVQLGKNGDIRRFDSEDLLLTGIRVGGWPGKLRHWLAWSTPEALVTVVNVDSLGKFLATMHEWYSSLLLLLSREKPEVILRAPLESAVFQRAAAMIVDRESSRAYRSDLDLLSW
jgi:hypothetical protein